MNPSVEGVPSLDHFGWLWQCPLPIRGSPHFAPGIDRSLRFNLPLLQMGRPAGRGAGRPVGLGNSCANGSRAQSVERIANPRGWIQRHWAGIGIRKNPLGRRQAKYRRKLSLPLFDQIPGTDLGRYCRRGEKGSNIKTVPIASASASVTELQRLPGAGRRCWLMDISEETREKSRDLFVAPDTAAPFIGGRSGPVIQNQAASDEAHIVPAAPRLRLCKLHDNRSILFDALDVQLERIRKLSCGRESKLFREVLIALESTVGELRSEVRGLVEPE